MSKPSESRTFSKLSLPPSLSLSLSLLLRFGPYSGHGISNFLGIRNKLVFLRNRVIGPTPKPPQQCSRTDGLLLRPVSRRQLAWHGRVYLPPARFGGASQQRELAHFVTSFLYRVSVGIPSLAIDIQTHVRGKGMTSHNWTTKKKNLSVFYINFIHTCPCIVNRI